MLGTTLYNVRQHWPALYEHNQFQRAVFVGPLYTSCRNLSTNTMKHDGCTRCDSSYPLHSCSKSNRVITTSTNTEHRSPEWGSDRRKCARRCPSSARRRRRIPSRSHLSTEKNPSAVQPKLPRPRRNPCRGVPRSNPRPLAIVGGPAPLPSAVQPEPLHRYRSPAQAAHVKAMA